jgi:hypothetical protein
MAIALRHIRDELIPGLTAISERTGQRLVTYQEFDRDVLVIKVGGQTLEIARSEIEDNRHLPKVVKFMERLMCAKVAGNVVTAPPQATQEDFYRALELTKEVVRDNLYRGEFAAEPSTAAPAKPSWPPAPELILDEEEHAMVGHRIVRAP